MAHTVIGAFNDRDAALAAVDRLVQSGFDRQDVHVEAQDEVAHQPARGNEVASSNEAPYLEREVATDSGLFGGFFASLFGGRDEHRAHQDAYTGAVSRGGAVVVVDADDAVQAERAASLLHSLGAVDVDDHATGTASAGTQGTREVVQEELDVGRRSLDRGGVRVIQRVTETPVRELVRLRQARAMVDRRPVDRDLSGADLSNFKEGTLEVRETVEEPVVAKTAHVVEEVRVGKEVREREQTVEGTVRRKDVEVERSQGQGERALAADAGQQRPTLSAKDRPKP